MVIWHADDMPEHIESMFDDCEYASDASSVLRRVNKGEAGWLARFARERVQQERETLELGLEKELQVNVGLSHATTHSHRGWCQSVCPPREVRSFRVLLMRDIHTTRRPAHRAVELTVWDVLSLSFDEAAGGRFKEGQRFQVHLISHASFGFSVLRRRGLLISLNFFFSGYKFTSDAEECVDGSRRRRRSCISQYEQDLTMDQTLIMMVPVFFTAGEPIAVLVLSLLVAAHRIMCQVDILVSSYFSAFVPLQSGLEL
jgi:hypothetical protein